MLKQTSRGRSSGVLENAQGDSYNRGIPTAVLCEDHNVGDLQPHPKPGLET